MLRIGQDSLIPSPLPQNGCCRSEDSLGNCVCIHGAVTPHSQHPQCPHRSSELWHVLVSHGAEDVYNAISKPPARGEVPRKPIYTKAPQESDIYPVYVHLAFMCVLEGSFALMELAAISPTSCFCLCTKDEFIPFSLHHRQDAASQHFQHRQTQRMSHYVVARLPLLSCK